MPRNLTFYGETPDKCIQWQLADSEQTDRVLDALAAAREDQPVEVSIVLKNQLHDSRLFVRPGRWNAWMVQDIPNPDD